MDITIVLPVSRDTHLKQIFTNLEFLTCDRKTTNLLVYIDGDLRLFEKARNFTMNSKFAEKLCIYRRKGLPNASSVRSRRRRIAEIHNEMKTLINPCTYVFMIEDDTLYPYNTLEKMKDIYLDHPYAGFVSGIEIGRWGYNHIGAWVANSVYDPRRITSMKMEEGVRKCDAAGFYCMLTRYELYTDHTFQPFQDAMGPDVEYGMSLRKQGLVNYVDFSIKCRHLTQKEELNFTNTEIVQVELNRINDIWETRSL